MNLSRFEWAESRVFWPVLLLLAVVAIEIPVVCGWMSEPAPNGSLLESGALSVRGSMGVPDYVIRGPMAIEGGDWHRMARSLLLGTDGGFLDVDLAQPVQVSALVVQAVADDRLEVEGSIDGERWRRLWVVPASPRAGGMRTRHQTFDPPELLRHLRIRNQAISGIAALGALRAYSQIPERWPPKGAAEQVPAGSYPWLSVAAVTRAKFFAALVATPLLLLSFWFGRGDRRFERGARIAKILLILSAAFATLGWWNFLQISSQDYARGYYNYADISHYYLGGKYSSELAYTNLYHCILVADAESGLRTARLERKMVRDLSSNGSVRALDLINSPGACKSHFEAEGWKRFKADQARLRSLFPPATQLRMLQDHGYNGTPVWGIAGWLLGLLGPADHTRIGIATALDPMLLVLSFGLLWMTFGFRPTCAALVLFGTGYAFGNGFTAGSFLRFGWLAASVVGICSLKREKWMLAGILLSLAALLRLFPVFMIGGVGMFALARMLGDRSFTVPVAVRRFVVGCAIGAICLVSLSIAVVGHAGNWQGFLGNTVKHKTTVGAQNMGLVSFSQLFYGTQREGHDRFRFADRARELGQQGGPGRVLELAIAILTLLLLARAGGRQEAWVCAILGFCWLAFVADITNYYYIAGILFALLCEEAPILIVPYAVLVVVWALVGVAFDYENLYLFIYSSGALVFFCLCALARFAIGSGRDRLVESEIVAIPGGP